MQTSWMLTESNEAADKVRELLERDEALYRDVGQRLRDLNPNVVVTLARGSSDHVASYATYLIPQCVGRVVASLPPSVHTVLKASLNLRNQIVLSISQSGASPDLVQALQACRKAGALTIALLNNVEADLSREADVVFDQRAGLERSVAATKSVLNSMAAVARIVGEWSEDQKLLSALGKLPDVMKQAASIQIDTEILRGRSGAFVLSRALGECVAREIALKMKETCGLQAEGFSTAEVRHGPREIIGEGFLILGLALPGSGADDVIATSLLLKGQGASVIIFGFGPPPSMLKEQNVMYVELPLPADERLAPIIALQALYPWLAKASVSFGRNPDQPKTLSKIVKTV